MSQNPLPQNKPPQEADLANLISIQARENRFIEFKSEYLPTTDSGKKKFLQSVAAFANGRGGDIILGMSEQEGTAAGIVPLALNPDDARLQMLELIRVHLRPALGGVQVFPVSIATGGCVLVVRVPKSWAGPHMLTYGDDRRFYIRDDGGKRPMDYEDVRDGFLSGETMAARLRNFRMERCAAILNDETPVPLMHRSRVVLHVIPFDSIALPHRFEPRNLFYRCDKLQPLNHDGYNRGFDIDGIFVASGSGQNGSAGYTSVFRSGAIESVDASWLAPWAGSTDKHIPYGDSERKLINAVDRSLAVLSELTVPPPYAVFLSLLNVKGYYMPTNLRRGGNTITRDDLYVPEIVLDTVPASVASALFPLFNSVWNACGYAQSLNYDKDGNWNAHA